MKAQAIAKLNKINQDFYNKIAADFDSSRHYSWPGWDILLRKIKPLREQNQELKILDLGCGNARFYDFLVQNLEQKLLGYYGVDFSKSLLDIAKSGHQLDNCHLIQGDILTQDLNQMLPINKKFDLIVVFGVMHHIASQETRLNLFKNIAKLLSQNGYFIFTTWQFLSSSRISSKIIDPTTKEGLKIFNQLGLKSLDLEDNDYILNWLKGQTAYRYGHHYTEAEIKNLSRKSNLEIVDIFLADGKEGNLNKYYILQNLK